MDTERFDDLTRAIARRRSRRSLVGGGLGLAAGMLGRVAPTTAKDATPKAGTPDACPSLSEEQQIAYARDWSEHALSNDTLDALDTYVADDVTWDAGAFAPLQGRDELKAALRTLLDGFPGMQFAAEHVVADGDAVAVHWRGVGTHAGEIFGMPPTGNAVMFEGINIYHFACGRIVGGSSEVDALGLRAQLQPGGAGPGTPQASAPAGSASPAADCEAITEAESAAVAQRYLDVWNTKDVAAFDDVASPDVVHHWGQGDDTVGIPDLRVSTEAFFVAFPDLTMTFDEVLADGDYVVIRWTITGTHDGPFFELEPSGVTAVWSGTNLYHVVCGRVVESWSQADAVGLRAQLQGTEGAPTPST